MEVIRQDIEAKGLSESILLDRNEWRKLIHVPDQAKFSFDSCNLPPNTWDKWLSSCFNPYVCGYYTCTCLEEASLEVSSQLV